MRTKPNPTNHTKMMAWAAGVENIISKPPRSDEDFSPEQIALYARTDFSKMRTWSILCEEMLDTQFSRIYFDRAREELHRRSISNSEINEMRRFAWLTAGWLNFVCMMWDWCSLDEKDIYLSIERQYTDGWISAAEKMRRIRYAKRYDNSSFGATTE